MWHSLLSKSSIASNAMTLHTIFCYHFWAKILQARFLQVDLFDWEHSSFFRCSSETFFFQSAHLRDASSQALLTIHHKKMPSSCAQTSGHDSSLHDELRHWLPVISSPNFVFGQLRRQNAPLQTAMDKIHTMDSLLWATDTVKSKKKCSQNVHPAPKMRPKIKKKNANMRSRCSPDREQEGKDTFFFDFGGRFLDRWCSFSLVLFPSAIYSCQGDLETCFTCLHQSKASQKSPRGVANLGLQTCMQQLHAAWCLAARQPASPACRSTQTTELVTSIVVLRFARTPPPLCHSWKEFFSFCSGNGGRIARALAILPAASAASSGATIDEA